jgi:hypothetical protein
MAEWKNSGDLESFDIMMTALVPIKEPKLIIIQQRDNLPLDLTKINNPSSSIHLKPDLPTPDLTSDQLLTPRKGDFLIGQYYSRGGHLFGLEELFL